MKDLRKFYINGEWVDPTHSNDLQVENPANEEMVATISLGGETDVNLAVAAAKRAFASYSQISVEERIALMEKLLQIYMDRYDEMSVAISVEMGAPISFATAAQADCGRGHINAALEALKQFEFERQVGTTRIVKEPIGVCGFITPWNWPINQISCKVAPALATGCTMVLKPSEIAPISGYLFTEIMHQAGFPAGVYNMVNGDGPNVGAVIAGHPDYKVTKGSVAYEVNFKEKNLLELEPHERAQEGVFLAFQYPVEIPGVVNKLFLKKSFDEVCKHQGVPELSDEAFDIFLKQKMELVEIDEKFLDRPVNVGFSGGEKKRNEILQMAVLNPRLAFLDETDSGLDIDALKTVAGGVNKLKNKNNAIVLVTHYQRLLNYIVPDFVHVIYQGKLIKTGGKELALEIEEKGFDWLINEAA